MYQQVFSEAANLGREDELFGMTKEEKACYDAHQAYVRAFDDTEVLGDAAEHSPADFFVSI